MGSSASLNDDMDYTEEEFEFCRNESVHVSNSGSTLSLNTCAAGGLPNQPVAATSSHSAMKRNIRKYSGFNLFDFLPIFTKKQDKVTEEQNLSHSLSSYIREAAGFISVARRHESTSDYPSALDAYTEGIRILLEGAQGTIFLIYMCIIYIHSCIFIMLFRFSTGDEDKQRRGLVKRKVEKYLSHAEELKQKVKGPVEAQFRITHPSGVSEELI